MSRSCNRQGAPAALLDLICSEFDSNAKEATRSGGLRASIKCKSNLTAFFGGFNFSLALASPLPLFSDRGRLYRSLAINPNRYRVFVVFYFVLKDPTQSLSRVHYRGCLVFVTNYKLSAAEICLRRKNKHLFRYRVRISYESINKSSMQRSFGS